MVENGQDVEIVTRWGVRPLEPERDRMGLDRREVMRQETRDGDNVSSVGLTC